MLIIKFSILIFFSSPFAVNGKCNGSCNLKFERSCRETCSILCFEKNQKSDKNAHNFLGYVKQDWFKKGQKFEEKLANYPWRRYKRDLPLRQNRIIFGKGDNIDLPKRINAIRNRDQPIGFFDFSNGGFANRIVRETVAEKIGNLPERPNRIIFDPLDKRVLLPDRPNARRTRTKRLTPVLKDAKYDVELDFIDKNETNCQNRCISSCRSQSISICDKICDLMK